MQNRMFTQLRSHFLPGFAVIAFLASALIAAPAQQRSKYPGSQDSTKAQDVSSFTTVFAYPNFASITGLTLNGDSSQVGSVLQVGPPAGSSLGSVWYDNAVSVTGGFSTSFLMQITPSSSSYTTADGMSFTIQGDGPDTLGEDTGQPGYNGIKNSIAVEFDTFQNFPLADPNNNHVAIQSCGSGINSMNHGGPCCIGIQPTLPLTMADGSPHEVVISYTPGSSGTGAFMVSIDKNLILSKPINLGTLLNLNGGVAWVGFTAGSGAAWETADIKNWIFSN